MLSRASCVLAPTAARYFGVVDPSVSRGVGVERAGRGDGVHLVPEGKPAHFDPPATKVLQAAVIYHLSRSVAPTDLFSGVAEEVLDRAANGRPASPHPQQVEEQARPPPGGGLGAPPVEVLLE